MLGEALRSTLFFVVLFFFLSYLSNISWNTKQNICYSLYIPVFNPAKNFHLNGRLYPLSSIFSEELCAILQALFIIKHDPNKRWSEKEENFAERANMKRRLGLLRLASHWLTDLFIAWYRRKTVEPKSRNLFTRVRCEHKLAEYIKSCPQAGVADPAHWL